MALVVTKTLQENNARKKNKCFRYEKNGRLGESNPGPLAPEAKIIPLNQVAVA